VTVGPPAHGGHCVSRVDGRVVFVRHALPGERVVAAVTEVTRSFCRADAVDVLDPAPDRVPQPCPFARPDLCGGCDLQHATAPAQLAWKAAVVREQLARLAGLADVDVPVAPLPGGLLGWRSRVRYAVSDSGVPGLRRHRSHEVVPIDRCLIAHPAIQALDVLARGWPGEDSVTAVASSGGDVTVLASGRVAAGPARVRERAVGREWTVDAAAFWQVHPHAPDTLADAVRDLLDPGPADHVWDLYGGAGLFTAALAPAVAGVTLVEADRRSVAAARRNLRDLPGVRVVSGWVERAVRRLPVPDLVVLDPPRAGAGAAVVRAIVAAAPRAVAYVACDPAALARDVGTFRTLGWRLATLRAYDMFPMTQHVECVALLTPGGP